MDCQIRVPLTLTQLYTFWKDDKIRKRKPARTYRTILHQSCRQAGNYLLKEEIPRRTIYNIIMKFDERGCIGDKIGFGRPKKLSQGQLI